jgi:hypothetical protein
MKDKSKTIAIDLTMCGNKDCFKRDKCIRHKDSGTVPAEQQSWADFNPENKKRCKYYGRKEYYHG